MSCAEATTRTLLVMSRDGRRRLLIADERTALFIYDAMQGRVVVADPVTELPVDLLAVALRNPGAVPPGGSR